MDNSTKPKVLEKIRDDGTKDPKTGKPRMMTITKYLHPDGFYRGCKPGGPKCKCAKDTYEELVKKGYK